MPQFLPHTARLAVSLDGRFSAGYLCPCLACLCGGTAGCFAWGAGTGRFGGFSGRSRRGGPALERYRTQLIAGDALCVRRLRDPAAGGAGRAGTGRQSAPIRYHHGASRWRFRTWPATGSLPVAFLGLPSLSGPVGLFHASTAEVGATHHLRLGIHGEYFRGKDFLIAGDADQRLSGGLVVGYTLRRDLELFGALLNSSNRNQRQRAPEDRDPEVIKTFGDLVLGGKWSHPLSLGGDVGVEVAAQVPGRCFRAGVFSQLHVLVGGTAFHVRLASAVGVPLRFHAGASFYADNSSNLHRLSGVTPATKEAAMFGYGMGPSRLRFALAVEVPLEKLFPRVPLVPFVEYHLAYVTAAAECGDFQDDGAPSCGSRVASKPCADNRDMQFVTLGMRAAVYRSITADVGMDLRVRSAGFPYGPPLPPYNVIFGVSYPFDVASLTRTVVVTRAARASGPWKTEGRLAGVVRSANGGAAYRRRAWLPWSATRARGRPPMPTADSLRLRCPRARSNWR